MNNRYKFIIYISFVRHGSSVHMNSLAIRSTIYFSMFIAKTVDSKRSDQHALTHAHIENIMIRNQCLWRNRVANTCEHCESKFLSTNYVFRWQSQHRQTAHAHTSDKATTLTRWAWIFTFQMLNRRSSDRSQNDGLASSHVNNAMRKKKREKKMEIITKAIIIDFEIRFRSR